MTGIYVMGSRAVNTASYYIPRFPVRYLLSGDSVTVINCALTTTTTNSTTISCISSSSSSCSTTTTRAYSYLTSSISSGSTGRTDTAGAYSYTAVEYEVLSLEEAPVRVSLQVAVDAPFQL